MCIVTNVAIRPAVMVVFPSRVTFIPTYTVNQRTRRRVLVSVTSLNRLLIDFQNSFTAGLSTRFATKRSLHIPPHLKDTAESSSKKF